MRTKKKRPAPTPEMRALLARAGSNDIMEASIAQRELAAAITVPIREGLMDGDNLNGIFEMTEFTPGQEIRYPKHFLAPGTEGDYFAWVIPMTGRIPYKTVTGDYVVVPTYKVGASIDAPLDYLRDARWDVFADMEQNMDDQFTIKVNNDGWHTILTSANGRNVTVSDSAAAAGFFTKRLIALMVTKMKRLGGGNVNTLNRARLTDVYGSHEMVEDIRSWDLTQVDDVTRRQILVAGGDVPVTQIFNVFIHPMDEFGVGERYQTYWDTTLGASMGSDEEVVIGLDQSKNDSFVMPVRENFTVFNDPALHREMKAGLYGWGRFGVSVLDNRRVLSASF